MDGGPVNDLVVLDDELIEEVASSDDDWLVLDPHPDFAGFWVVECLNPDFFYDFEDLVGAYRALWPENLDEFLERADRLGYPVAFGEDPSLLLDRFEHLDDPPPFEINSPLPDTVGGLLPYQLRGFNYLKDISGAAVWSTGTGKMVLATALVWYHQIQGTTDLSLYVAKDHNTTNVQRALRRLANMDSILLRGKPSRRINLYADVLGRLEDGEPGLVLVTNYEKFYDDEDVLTELISDRRVAVIWDEMPTKLKNRRTQRYHAVARTLYESADTKQRGVRVAYETHRPSALYQWMTTATPIEQNPEDTFNCYRIVDPRVLGPAGQFNAEYVARVSYFDRSKPVRFKNLDRMSLRIANTTHRADKERDPEVAKYFPKKAKRPEYVDWNDRDRRVYDLLEQELTHRALTPREDREEGPLSELNVLGMINVMQMLCDAPTLVEQSAIRRAESLGEAEAMGLDPEEGKAVLRGSKVALTLLEEFDVELTNDRHTKLAKLRELVTEDYADDKILIYTTWGEETLLPILSERLDEWGVTHVVYAGSRAQLQRAQDAFREDDSIRVFLSSDRGSDSLDLEQARVGINYNQPWSWARRYQRENRNDRVITQHAELPWIDLLMADSVEDRRMEIIFQKYGYHWIVFEGGVPDDEIRGDSMRDLLYVLTGRELEDLVD